MALGAAPARLVRDVLWSGSRLMVAGIVAGLAAAALATRVLGSVLYEVSARDPYVFAGTAGAVAIIVLGAAYVPARRAARIDPVLALRAE
jgi:putative ABC transport system permease protein